MAKILQYSRQPQFLRPGEIRPVQNRRVSPLLGPEDACLRTYSSAHSYPYLPVVRNKELTSDPWDPPRAIVEYATQGGELVIAGLDEEADLSGSDACSDYGFEDADEVGESLDLTALTDLSEYPTEYQEDLAAFLESIEGIEDGEE